MYSREKAWEAAKPPASSGRPGRCALLATGLRSGRLGFPPGRQSVQIGRMPWFPVFDAECRDAVVNQELQVAARGRAVHIDEARDILGRQRPLRRSQRGDDGIEGFAKEATGG